MAPYSGLSASSAPASRNLAPLTALRFFAAVSVLLFHFGKDLESMAWGRRWFVMGNGAVAFFFFLSGFVLAHVYGAGPIRDRREFYVARLARVVPLYLLAWFTMVVFIGYREGVKPAEVALGSVLLQAWIPGQSQKINEPGWSLSVELFFYLSFPFVLGALLRLRRSAQLIAVIVGTWLANLALHVVLVELHGGGPEDRLSDFAYYHPLTHVATFVAGAAAALLYARERARILPWRGPLVAAGVGVPFLLVAAFGPLLQRYHHNGMFVPAFVAVVYGAAELQGPLGRLLSSRPLQKLGEISYGIYILQAPVALVAASIAKRAFGGLDPTAGMFFEFVLLFFVALAAFHGLEVPARSRVRALFRRRRPTVLADAAAG